MRRNGRLRVRRSAQRKGDEEGKKGRRGTHGLVPCFSESSHHRRGGRKWRGGKREKTQTTGRRR